MEAEKQRRSAARWLAPLAIVAVALVTMAVVSGSSLDDDSGGSEKTATSNAGQTQPDTGASAATEEPSTGGGKGVYVVEAGDTLSAIAAEHDLTVAELEALNPDIDPQALSEGQRLKLR